MTVRPSVPENGLISGRKHALDGLRIIAVAGVFLFHTVNGFAPGGSIGVDVFFTLSGFVITLLIMKEYRATGRVRLGFSTPSGLPGSGRRCWLFAPSSLLSP